MQKILNRIEFYFVKPFNQFELRSEILTFELSMSGMNGNEISKAVKKFGKTKVMYPDFEVRTFSAFNWVLLGEDVLNMNVKIKRYGRN